jgi:hypothetical protein
MFFSSPPIAEGFTGEPNREFGCGFRETKTTLLGNGDGEREALIERPVQVIWGRNGIVILVPPTHDELEFVVGAIPQALAKGVGHTLGRESSLIWGDQAVFQGLLTSFQVKFSLTQVPEEYAHAITS